MRALSFWARDHKWLSRLLIIFVLYPLLKVVGFVTGDLLSSFGIFFGQSLYYPFILVACTIVLTYPSKKAPYGYRKLMDCLMAFCTFCLIAIFGNRVDLATGTMPTNSAIAATPAKAIPIKPKKFKKNLTKLIHDARKKYKKAGNWAKIVILILLTLLAISLSFLLGAWACTVSCTGGAEVLPWIIFILGTGGIVVGVAAAARWVNRKYSKQKETPSKAN